MCNVSHPVIRKQQLLDLLDLQPQPPISLNHTPDLRSMWFALYVRPGPTGTTMVRKRAANIEKRQTLSRPKLKSEDWVGLISLGGILALLVLVHFLEKSDWLMVVAS